MKPAEIRTALHELKKEVGIKANISLHIDGDHERGEPVYIGLYPFGVCNGADGYLSARAADFAEAIATLRKDWEAFRDKHRQTWLQKMALAIIKITADQGECTDAALRQDFDAGMLASMGAEACELANQMAANGPFTIKENRGANAA